MINYWLFAALASGGLFFLRRRRDLGLVTISLMIAWSLSLSNGLPERPIALPTFLVLGITISVLTTVVMGPKLTGNTASA